ncbi:hypothetical protein [Neobacillus drentensis]
MDPAWIRIDFKIEKLILDTNYLAVGTDFLAWGRRRQEDIME